MAPIWTALWDWIDRMPISKTRLQQLLGIDGNLDYLLRGKQISYSVVAKGSDTGTTSTSFVDVDMTNYKITITPKSTRVKVEMTFSGGIASNVAEYDIVNVNTGLRAGHATHGLGAALTNSLSIEANVHIVGYFTGLTPGTTYEFRLQYRTVAGGGTAFVYGVYGEVFVAIAEEV